MLAQVRGFLQGAPSHRAEVHAEVASSAPDRWTVLVVTDVDGTPGERSLEADSCAALANATALIVAWTIEPLATRPPTPEALAPPPPVAVASPTAVPVAATTPAPPSAVAGVLAVAAQGDLGMFPKEDLAAEITLGAALRRLRFEVSGSAWLPEDATKSGTAGGAHLHFLEGGLRGCRRDFVRPSLELDPCLGAGLVHVSSVGFDETDSYTRDAWFSWVRGDALATWTFLGPLALRGLVGMAVPLTRPQVVIQQPPGGNLLLYRPSVIAGRVELGLEVHFP